MPCSIPSAGRLTKGAPPRPFGAIPGPSSISTATPRSSCFEGARADARPQTAYPIAEPRAPASGSPPIDALPLPHGCGSSNACVPLALLMRDGRRSIKICCRIVAHSGSGSSLVSGANGRTSSPSRNTTHMVIPEYRNGSAYPLKTLSVSKPLTEPPTAATSRPPTVLAKRDPGVRRPGGKRSGEIDRVAAEDRELAETHDRDQH